MVNEGKAFLGPSGGCFLSPMRLALSADRAELAIERRRPALRSLANASTHPFQ